MESEWGNPNFFFIISIIFFIYLFYLFILSLLVQKPLTDHRPKKPHLWFTLQKLLFCDLVDLLTSTLTHIHTLYHSNNTQHT